MRGRFFFFFFSLPVWEVKSCLSCVAQRLKRIGNLICWAEGRKGRRQWTLYYIDLPCFASSPNSWGSALRSSRCSGFFSSYEQSIVLRTTY
jgi:hypothetical protein